MAKENLKERYIIERQQQAIHRKEHVLTTATALFLEKGLGNVTMNDIMVAANISRGTLYNYYPNIHEIAFDISYSMWDKILKDGLNLTHDAKSSEALTKEVLLLLIEQFDSHKDAHAYMGMFDHLYSTGYPSSQLAKAYSDYIVHLYNQLGIHDFSSKENYQKAITYGNIVISMLSRLALRGSLLAQEQHVSISEQLEYLKKIIQDTF